MATVSLTDTLTFDAPRRTSDGYMAVRAAAARTGIYDYRADEVGAPNDQFKSGDIVKVYRPPEEVFDEEAMRSFIGRPITDNHPSEAVTADNWKRHSRGTVMSAGRKTAQDGDFLAFDLVLMDSAAIRKVDAGKRELSNGYNCDLDWTPGVTPEGLAYDAKQTNIRGNHVALVDAGRAGTKCRIGDGVRSGFPATHVNTRLVADLSTKEGRVKLTNLDGMSVNLTDETATEQALSTLDRKVTEANDKAKTLQDKVEELEGEKAVLEKKLKDADDANDPAALDKRVADRAALVDTAGKLVKDFDATGKSDADIRREVVKSKLGDAAKDMEDGEVAGAFRMLAADAKDKKSEPTQPRQPAVLDSIRNPQMVADTAATRDTIRDMRYG